MSEQAASTVTRLFHYTDAAGLLGILRTSRIWASDFRFLNDSLEAVYARELFTNVLHQLENPALEPSHPAHNGWQGFGQVFDEYRSLLVQELGSPKIPVYVACFCESGDLLGQWRAYGSDHGYAIELDMALLRESVADALRRYSSATVAKVRYGSQAARNVLQTVVDGVNSDTNLGHPGAHAHLMAVRLTRMLAEIKHPGFSEENEWRFVIASEGEDPDSVQFRATRMAIVPYVEVAIAESAIVGVRVGPGHYVETRQEGIRRLFRALRRDTPVTCSEIPLRT
jgi:hypothetical protein